MRTAVNTVGAMLALVALLVIADAVPWRAPAPAANAQEALSNYSITVEIDGIASTTFRSVEGLTSEIEVVEFRDGAGGPVIKLPGKTKFSNLVLRFDPKPQGDELWKWYADALAGNVKKKTVAVLLSSKDGKEVRRYKLLNVWPVQWTGPRLVGASAAVPVEEIHLAYDSFDRLLK